jgi:hypothetical protein
MENIFKNSIRGWFCFKEIWRYWFRYGNYQRAGYSDERKIEIESTKNVGTKTTIILNLEKVLRSL